MSNLKHVLGNLRNIELTPQAGAKHQSRTVLFVAFLGKLKIMNIMNILSKRVNKARYLQVNSGYLMNIHLPECVPNISGVFECYTHHCRW